MSGGGSAGENQATDGHVQTRLRGLVVQRLAVAMPFPWPQRPLFLEITKKTTYEALQILPVLPTKAAVRFPYPVPTWSMTSAGGEEDNSVVRFDCENMILVS